MTVERKTYVYNHGTLVNKKYETKQNFQLSLCMYGLHYTYVYY